MGMDGAKLMFRIDLAETERKDAGVLRQGYR